MDENSYFSPLLTAQKWENIQLHSLTSILQNVHWRIVQHRNIVLYCRNIVCFVTCSIYVFFTYGKPILIYTNSPIRTALLKLKTSCLTMALCIRKYIKEMRKFFQLNNYYISYYWLLQMQFVAPMISCFLLKLKFFPSQIADPDLKICIF